MYMSCTPVLKFSFVWKFVNHHGASTTHDNIVYKCFYSMVKVTCCQQNISSNAFMHGFVDIFLHILFYWNLSISFMLYIYCCFWETILVILYFIYETIPLLFQNCSKIFIPTKVCAAQCEEKLEGSKIIQFCKHFKFSLSPVPRCLFDVIKYRIWIIQF